MNICASVTYTGLCVQCTTYTVRDTVSYDACDSVYNVYYTSYIIECTTYIMTYYPTLYIASIHLYSMTYSVYLCLT